MENYIVRVYRRGDQNPDEVVGRVEMVEVDDKRPFRSLSELVKILLLCPGDLEKSELRVPHDQSAPLASIAKNFRHR